MKRVICTVVIALAIALLGGCVQENVPAEPIPVLEVIIDEPTTTANENEPIVVESTSPRVEVPAPPFFLMLGDARVNMGANVNEIIDALGEPIAEFTMPSCAFDGTDIVFRFPGFQVHTIPIGEENFVHTIVLTDDTVSTFEGIRLGSAAQDLTYAYGHDYTHEYSMYTFTREHTSISFFVENGIVISIVFELDVNSYFEVG